MQKIEAKETNDEFKNDFTIVIRLTNKKCYTLQVNNETGELEVVVKE